MYDFLIVGAGIAGITLAERLATQLNKKIVIVEKRDHIGGNCYDYYNEHGLIVHKYGPHIFHTNIKRVWDYLYQFTDWYHYQHKVLAYVDGQKVPFPVNLDTINYLFNKNISTEELKIFHERLILKTNVEEIKNAKDMAISRVGEELYEKFFKNYTKKQWDLLPEDLASEVTARIPLRLNRDPRYFNDRYQGIPKRGYTTMFKRMLDNPNIHVLLNADYKQIINEIKFSKMIYTGSIDYFFEYIYGNLPYRSLRFELETLPFVEYQEVGTVNYPNDYDFTRITEFKHLTGQMHPWTVIMREYPLADGEPYYPIPKEENQRIFSKYTSEAQKLKNVYFLGRLAEYKYFNMDVVVDRALDLVQKISRAK